MDDLLSRISFILIAFVFDKQNCSALGIDLLNLLTIT